MALKELGWDLHFEAVWRVSGFVLTNPALKASQQHFNCVPARVVSQQRGLWRIAGEFPEHWAAPSGKLRSLGEMGGDWPVVGDWVAAEMAAEDQRSAIHAILPRRTRFIRKVAGRRAGEQVIAANVDVAMVVVGLDGDFNSRRLERYLALCWESGAEPVVVLNKADKCQDITTRSAETQRIAMGAPVIVLSALTGDGVALLQDHLLQGKTVVLLGSSGAGKSTLANRLLGREAQTVQAVRGSDGRGQHTTAARELFLLPCGAVLIDTPGLRELQLWNAQEGMSRAFADIDELASRCRFRDCAHSGEPGCAVRAALDACELDPQRLANRRKLEREQEFLRRKVDEAARKAERDRIKLLQRNMRQKYLHE